MKNCGLRSDPVSDRRGAAGPDAKMALKMVDGRWQMACQDGVVDGTIGYLSNEMRTLGASLSCQSLLTIGLCCL